MGRAPCCDKANVKKGPWSPEEDAKLKEFIEKFGTGGNWIALPQKVGLKRCGKSCRLRWLNYLRPNIKHGEFSDEEDRIICTLYATIGSRWSIIAAQLPGRTDNDIKNYWNTKLKKKLMGTNIINNPYTSKLSHIPFPGLNLLQSSQLSHHHQQLFSTTADHYNSLYFQAALDSISAPQDINYPYSNFSLSTNTQCSYNYLQNQQGNLVDNNNYKNNNMLVFGGNEAASCSSSDGSCSQISYGGAKEETMGFVSINGVESSDNKQKFMLHHYEKPIGISNVGNSELLLQCDDVEQVKRLISGSSSNNNDENKTIDDDDDQRLMYYYHC